MKRMLKKEELMNKYRGPLASATFELVSRLKTIQGGWLVSNYREVLLSLDLVALEKFTAEERALFDAWVADPDKSRTPEEKERLAELGTRIRDPLDEAATRRVESLGLRIEEAAGPDGRRRLVLSGMVDMEWEAWAPPEIQDGPLFQKRGAGEQDGKNKAAGRGPREWLTRRQREALWNYRHAVTHTLFLFGDFFGQLEILRREIMFLDVSEDSEFWSLMNVKKASEVTNTIKAKADKSYAESTGQGRANGFFEGAKDGSKTARGDGSKTARGRRVGPSASMSTAAEGEQEEDEEAQEHKQTVAEHEALLKYRRTKETSEIREVQQEVTGAFSVEPGPPLRGKLEAAVGAYAKSGWTKLLRPSERGLDMPEAWGASRVTAIRQAYRAHALRAARATLELASFHE
eukprot:tig00000053_g23505.t1